MRAWIGRAFGPAFEAVVGRLDPSIGIEEHLELAERIAARWPSTQDPATPFQTVFQTAHDQLMAGSEAEPVRAKTVADVTAAWHGLEQSREGDSETSGGAHGRGCEQALIVLARPGVWREDPHAARRAAAELSASLSSHEWSGEAAHDAAARVLVGHPPRDWFLFKRGTLFGSSRLLDFLIRVCALEPAAATDPRVRESDDPVQAGTVEVLDRLIRHIEVRRGDALGFAQVSMTAEDDPFVERMRFAIALIEASDVFQDLRYLNTAMKLVDRALTELRRPLRGQDETSARHRDLAYLTSLSAQETRMREVITG